MRAFGGTFFSVGVCPCWCLYPGVIFSLKAFNLGRELFTAQAFVLAGVFLIGVFAFTTKVLLCFRICKFVLVNCGCYLCTFFIL